MQAKTNKSPLRRLLLPVAVASASLVTVACAARYQTIHKGLGGELGPGSSSDGTPQSQPPTAGVEVLKGGKVVTKVGVDTDFTIRPTDQTLDPDNADPASEPASGCRNPGIVKAAYAISDGARPEAARVGTSCSSLEVPHKIATPGTYTVSLTVTSDEGETASSSMTLVVVPKDQVDDPTVDGGFVVTATPPVARPGEPITFEGDCTRAKKISWSYGDGKSGVGAETEHAYQTPGQYEVQAECERPTGPKLSSSVTVTIIPPGTTPGGDRPNVDDGSNGIDGKDDGGKDDGGKVDGGSDGKVDGDGGDGSDAGDGDGDGSTDVGDGDGTGDSSDGDDGSGDGTGDSSDGDDDPPGNGDPGQTPGQTPYQNTL